MRNAHIAGSRRSHSPSHADTRACAHPSRASIQLGPVFTPCGRSSLFSLRLLHEVLIMVFFMLRLVLPPLLHTAGPTGAKQAHGKCMRTAEDGNNNDD
jgi:hypothetical protein